MYFLNYFHKSHGALFETSNRIIYKIIFCIIFMDWNLGVQAGEHLPI